MNEATARRINGDLLRPLLHTSWRFWALVVFLGAIVLTGLEAAATGRVVPVQA